MENIKETSDYINSKTGNFKPEIALILGSGLGNFCDNLSGISLKYDLIPNFLTTGVQGHKGELLFCEIESKKAVIMQGRFHYYEGNSMQEITFPIKVFKRLGVKLLFITNAAGALHKDLNIGDIVLIKDHINFMGNNPLIGKNDDSLGERFPDMGDCYTKEYRNLALDCAKKLNINLKEGVYTAVSGPSYETKAEVRAFKMLGGDMVGMSSVPEAIIANYLKMKILGLSLITNYATGVSEKKLSHNEVMEAGFRASLDFTKLIREIFKNIA